MRLIISPSAMLAVFLSVAFCACSAAQDAQETVNNVVPDFSSDIRPILAAHCFQCHGPDDDTRSAELRLDQPEGLFLEREGIHVVAKGDADQSEMIRRILSSDPDVTMPPAASNKQLTGEQKKLLIDWVNSGAEWSPHWSFVRPDLPEIPRLNNEDGISFSPIDAFLMQRLQAVGLSFSQPADPWTQIRRVFLDLTGLPPTPEEADVWLMRIWKSKPSAALSTEIPQADEQAYLAMVDELLARPAYGERWARRWLDLARYADTNGYEKDRPRSIWPYRDWVIQAINSDMPFDQFTIEQLAGDLLPNASESQLVATGFHRNTMLNEEGGIDPLEFRFHAMTDRVATTGTTWLGLTVGCAQCHTHKFDPLTHHEYFQLMALMNNADEPSLELRTADYSERFKASLQQAQNLLQQLPSKWPVTELDTVPVQVLNVSGSETEKFSIAPDGIINVSGGNPEQTIYQIDLDLTSAEVDTLQLVALTPDGAKGPGRAAQGNFVLNELELSLVFRKRITRTATDVDSSESKLTEDTEIPLSIVSAKASVAQPGFPIEHAFDGNQETGWAIAHGKSIPEKVTATFNFRQQIALPKELALREHEDIVLRVRLHQKHGRRHTLGRFQFVVGRSLLIDEVQQRRQESIQSAFDTWLVQQRSTAVPWTSLRPVSVRSNLPHLRIQTDDSIFVSGDTTKQDVYEIELAASSQPITAIRLEALPDERLPGRGPGTTFYEGRQGDFYLTELNATADNKSLTFRSATESYARNQFGNSPASAQLTFDGDIQTGWSVYDGQGERHTAVYVLQQPVPAGVPLKIRMNFGRHFASSLGRFRFAATDSQFDTSNEPIARRMSQEIEDLLLKPEMELSDAERDSLFDQFLLDTPAFAKESEQIRRLLLPPASPTTLILQERPDDNPRPTFRHHRGEYLQPKDRVQPDIPSFLHPWPAETPANRLGLARWLVDEQNPLTARVIVNQHWAAFFGQGIVPTVDDFGLQGAPPSHPLLLDWLAVTFVRDDRWSIKKLHRRIVSSAAYRQSSVVNSAALARDPGNSLLAFSPRFRLEAEIVRDAVLYSTALLSTRQGGPPVFPPQPPGITEVAFGRPGWDVSQGEDRYRRSIYTHIKRTAPFAMVTTFDGPSGESCIARRTRSNSPLQALTLLNDLMFVDAAAAVGVELSGKRAQLLSAPDQPESDQPRSDHSDIDRQLVTTLFRRLLTRFPDSEELDELLRFVVRQRAAFEIDQKSAETLLGNHLPAKQHSTRSGNSAQEQHSQQVSDAAAWAALTRGLISVDEFQTRN